MTYTRIEWTDRTWNPVRGCSRVSAGCLNCYAERSAIRQKHDDYEGFVNSTKSGPRWTGKVALIPERLEDPFHWKKPQRIFVNSMSDLFHERLPAGAIAAVFGAMAANPQHTFQVLTKRPMRMLRWLLWMRTIKDGPSLHAAYCLLKEEARSVGDDGPIHCKYGPDPDAAWPLRNVWLGVSVENQATADERIPLLLETPAAVRFVSYEPALGPVAFSSWLHDQDSACPTLYDDEGDQVLADYQECCCDEKDRRLNWLIIGGESGPRARPCNVEWIRSAMRQAKAAGVPVFVKQLGANVREPDPDGRPGIIQWTTEDRKGGDMAEWPEDLRVRDFPGDGR